MTAVCVSELASWSKLSLVPGAGRSPNRNHRTNFVYTGKIWSPEFERDTAEWMWVEAYLQNGRACGAGGVPGLWQHLSMTWVSADLLSFQSFWLLFLRINNTSFLETIALKKGYWSWGAASREWWVRGAVGGFLLERSRSSWRGMSHKSPWASLVSSD